MPTVIKLFLCAASLCSASLPTFSQMVTKATQTVVTAMAGNVSCIFSSQTPSAPTGVHATCAVSGTTELTMDTVVAVGANGIAGAFVAGGNQVTWIFTQVTAGTIAYQIAATLPSGPPASGAGSF
jgi:hypothetical protein